MSKDCPLCLEPLDVTELNFKPCSCGYQLCVFCWHAVQERLEGKCPACRQPYKEQNIQFKVPDPEDLQKQVERTKHRRHGKKPTRPGWNFHNIAVVKNKQHLANVRVPQRTLVYLIGVPEHIANEDFLAGPDVFGQFGEVTKVAIGRKGPVRHGRPPTYSAHITFGTNEASQLAINAVENGELADALETHRARASHGTNKYCPRWLRDVPCRRPDCMFLHEEVPTDNIEDVGHSNERVSPRPSNNEVRGETAVRPSGEDGQARTDPPDDWERDLESPESSASPSSRSPPPDQLSSQPEVPVSALRISDEPLIMQPQQQPSRKQSTKPRSSPPPGFSQPVRAPVPRSSKQSAPHPPGFGAPETQRLQSQPGPPAPPGLAQGLPSQPIGTTALDAEQHSFLQKIISGSSFSNAPPGFAPTSSIQQLPAFPPVSFLNQPGFLIPAAELPAANSQGTVDNAPQLLPSADDPRVFHFQPIILGATPLAANPEAQTLEPHRTIGSKSQPQAQPEPSSEPSSSPQPTNGGQWVLPASLLAEHEQASKPLDLSSQDAFPGILSQPRQQQPDPVWPCPSQPSTAPVAGLAPKAQHARQRGRRGRQKDKAQGHPNGDDAAPSAQPQRHSQTHPRAKAARQGPSHLDPLPSSVMPVPTETAKPRTLEKKAQPKGPTSKHIRFIVHRASLQLWPNGEVVLSTKAMELMHEFLSDVLRLIVAATVEVAGSGAAIDDQCVLKACRDALPKRLYSSCTTDKSGGKRLKHSKGKGKRQLSPQKFRTLVQQLMGEPLLITDPGCQCLINVLDALSKALLQTAAQKAEQSSPVPQQDAKSNQPPEQKFSLRMAQGPMPAPTEPHAQWPARPVTRRIVPKHVALAIRDNAEHMQLRLKCNEYIRSP